jgi:beta-lactamase superfamily II metal-dependent hydrolase
VTITPAVVSIDVGTTLQLAAVAKDAQGNVLTRSVTWTMLQPAIASVSTSGLVTGLAPGSTNASASVDGVSGFASITINLVRLPLEIHQINVGWGSAVLIRGPDGTSILMEAGNTGDGTRYVVPYLISVGLNPLTGLTYTIAGHQHCDHIGGMDEVIAAGYNVRVRNYYNGSNTTSSCVTQWSAAAATTAAGALAVPAVGATIPLGSGARLTFIAVNGTIIGGGQVAVSDENDRSIGVLVQYGGFDYLWASDLGGGDADKLCTGRSTDQRDVESTLIRAISPGGAAPLISAGGIDVLHVNHHGSESSTNAVYMNLARPQVALISTGAGQTPGWDFPRMSVLESVLLAKASSCVSAPPAVVFQSEEGAPLGAQTSLLGFSVGDVKVVTDGVGVFTVSATGRVTQGPIEVTAAGLPKSFPLDDVASVALAMRPALRGARP